MPLLIMYTGNESLQLHPGTAKASVARITLLCCQRNGNNEHNYGIRVSVCNNNSDFEIWFQVAPMGPDKQS